MKDVFMVQRGRMVCRNAEHVQCGGAAPRSAPKSLVGERQVPGVTPQRGVHVLRRTALRAVAFLASPFAGGTQNLVSTELTPNEAEPFLPDAAEGPCAPGRAAPAMPATRSSGMDGARFDWSGVIDSLGPVAAGSR